VSDRQCAGQLLLAAPPVAATFAWRFYIQPSRKLLGRLHQGAIHPLPGTTDDAAAAVFATVSTAAVSATTIDAATIRPSHATAALTTTTTAISATAVSISSTTITLPCASIPTTPSHL